MQEDIGTTYKLIWQATRIYYLDKILYYHCLRDGSITSQKTEKYLQDGIAMRLKQYRDLAAWGYYSPEKQKTDFATGAYNKYQSFKIASDEILDNYKKSTKVYSDIIRIVPMWCAIANTTLLHIPGNRM